jgi:hypothetical protein
MDRWKRQAKLRALREQAEEVRAEAPQDHGVIANWMQALVSLLEQELDDLDSATDPRLYGG